MNHARWRVEVSEKCLGSGLCTGTAPGHFRLSDGRSQPRFDLVEPADTVVEAAETCPAEAIVVRDASTNAIVAPAD